MEFGTVRLNAGEFGTSGVLTPGNLERQVYAGEFGTFTFDAWNGLTPKALANFSPRLERSDNLGGANLKRKLKP